MQQYNAVSRFVEDVENEVLRQREEEIFYMAIGSPLIQKKSTTSCSPTPLPFNGESWKVATIRS